MKKFGLALGGGGTKGAYHMGVWKALSETGIKISAVCGTSIGSINGAIIAQGDADVAYELWQGISLDNIVETADIQNVGHNLFDAKNIINVLASMHKNNGLETEPLRKLLESIIDEEKLKNSDIDFGLVTYDINSLEAVELFYDEIPDGKLIEFIMASASLPGLKQVVIDDKKYIDGGFADNLPANMLIKRGITDIITVDVGGVGITRGIAETGINHINIKCSENIIGRTCGEYYSFNISDWHRAKLSYSADIISGIEKAAKIYGIDRLKIYTFNSLCKGVMLAYEKNCKIFNTSNENQAFNFDSFKPSEKQVLTRLCTNIISKKSDSVAIRFFSGVIGDIVTAANAIAYFAGKNEITQQ